jgi:hypothetical protein
MYVFISMRATCPSQLTHLDLITLIIMVKSRSNVAPHCEIFFSPLLLHTSWVQMFSEALCSQTSSNLIRSTDGGGRYLDLKECTGVTTARLVSRMRLTHVTGSARTRYL